MIVSTNHRLKAPAATGGESITAAIALEASVVRRFFAVLFLTGDAGMAALFFPISFAGQLCVWRKP